MSEKRLKLGHHLYLVDGSTFIFRAYHALPPLTRKSDGLPVGAVNGFCNMLYKLLLDTRQGDQPTHLAVIFDYSARSFRNDIYPDYKANRPPPPEDLVPQFSIIRDAVRAFNVPCIEMENVEADDLIATYARDASDAGAKVTIVSSDKDLMQLIDGNVEMLDTMKDRHIGPAEVEEKFGVGPEKVVEVQALAGDSVDNVPGVPGIGVKTAAELINTYGDLETLLDRAEDIKQPKRRANLIEHADMARISRELVTLKRDVNVDMPAAAFTVTEPAPEVLLSFLREMEFNVLTRRVASGLGIDDVDAVIPAPAPKAESRRTPSAKSGSEAGPSSVSVVNAPIDVSKYRTVTTWQQLDEWMARAHDAGLVAIDTETTSLDPMQAKLVGISLAVAPGEACYIPLGHGVRDGLALDGDTADMPAQLPLDEVLERLEGFCRDPSILKIGQNIKFDLVILARYGLRLDPIDDTMLMSYALDAGLHKHGLDELSELILGHVPIPFKDVAGDGKNRITFDRVPIDAATRYAAEDADITGRLHRVLKPRLAREHRTAVYETLERPLAPVLAAMETAGVKADRGVLARLSKEFYEGMVAFEDRAHELAGERFNLASPKQLGEILFEKMGMEGARKTRRGAFATGADILESLAAQGHELPRTVLDWRQLSKLKSTYTDALTEFINPDTGRIHTSYSLAATSTGRLSSSEPNLQNIPIRTEEGRKIRTAFVADEGCRLVSADYGQIELRILAHIADIHALKQAFADGLDIHAMTASEIFGVPIAGMDPMMRRRAKAINFGIIYGISAFGLGHQLSIPRGEAQRYIKSYFERFPGIRDYMERTKDACRRDGFVTTLFGRRIHLPEIKSKNQGQRSYAERAAINAPIQGTASDIIRRAMIRIPGGLEKSGLKARMLLQVHDELVFEAPEAEVEEIFNVVSRIMKEAALPALELEVPLTVDTGSGPTWAAAH